MSSKNENVGARIPALCCGVVTALALSAAATFAHAQASPAVIDPASAAVQPSAMIKDLESRGYTDIRDVEWDDGHWEVEGRSPDGKEVDLEIDATTGEILKEEDD